MNKYFSLIAVLALSGCSIYSTNQKITYLVAFESEDFTSTNAYKVDMNSDLKERIELDGGYVLEVAESPTGISTVLLSPSGEAKQVMDQSVGAYSNGNFYLICGKSDAIKRITPIPQELPTCKPT